MTKHEMITDGRCIPDLINQLNIIWEKFGVSVFVVKGKRLWHLVLFRMGLLFEKKNVMHANLIHASNNKVFCMMFRFDIVFFEKYRQLLLIFTFLDQVSYLWISLCNCYWPMLLFGILTLVNLLLFKYRQTYDTFCTYFYWGYGY
jgi:hypothetical protein